MSPPSPEKERNHSFPQLLQSARAGRAMNYQPFKPAGILKLKVLKIVNIFYIKSLKFNMYFILKGHLKWD